MLPIFPMYPVTPFASSYTGYLLRCMKVNDLDFSFTQQFVYV